MVEAPRIEIKDDGVIIENGQVRAALALEAIDELDHYAKSSRVGRTTSGRRDWNPRDMSHWN